MSLKTVTLSLEKLFLKTGRRRTIQARAANLAPWLPAAARFATHRPDARVSLETHITCLTGRGELDTLILTSWHVSDSAKVAGIRYSYGTELVMGPHRRRRVPGRIQAPIHGRRRCRPPARAVTGQRRKQVMNGWTRLPVVPAAGPGGAAGELGGQRPAVQPRVPAMAPSQSAMTAAPFSRLLVSRPGQRVRPRCAGPPVCWGALCAGGVGGSFGTQMVAGFLSVSRAVGRCDDREACDCQHLGFLRVPWGVAGRGDHPSAAGMGDGAGRACRGR